jgi:preprotein translocase subunit SecY
MLNMVSGSAMQNFSIFSMGVSPYITASIVIQLLQMDIIPKYSEKWHLTQALQSMRINSRHSDLRTKPKY